VTSEGDCTKVYSLGSNYSHTAVNTLPLRPVSISLRPEPYSRVYRHAFGSLSDMVGVSPRYDLTVSGSFLLSHVAWSDVSGLELNCLTARSFLALRPALWCCEIVDTWRGGTITITRLRARRVGPWELVFEDDLVRRGAGNCPRF
jgi:hypothetical protein